jgi:hypothetical protein
VASSSYHVVGHVEKAQHAWSHHGVVVVMKSYLLVLNLFPLPLELCVSSVEVNLSGLEALSLLLFW